MSATRTVISGVRIVLGPPGAETGEHDVVISGGRIQSVTPAGRAPAPAPENARRIDGRGLIACPGFVDLHVHGAKGSDFMDATDEAFGTIAEYHAAGGTTAYYATTTSETTEAILAAVDLAGRWRERDCGAVEVIGVHAEGPYFARKKHGCHDPAQVRDPSPGENRRLLDRAGIIRRVTLAPELPGALDLIRDLSREGIIASGGHSEATLDEVLRAADCGMGMITHLYSAMSTIAKDGPFRIAGMLEATLLDDRLATELIADLRHAPKGLLLLALKAKARDTVCFTTDAMRGAGMPDGIYTFGSMRGTKAVVENGVARNLENTGFASSTVRMIDLVRNGVEALGLSLADSARLASLVPAKIAGVADRKGTLDPGKDADIVLLSETPRIEVKMTIGRGEVRAGSG